MQIASLLQLGIRQKMVLVLLCVLTLALGTTSWLTIKQHEEGVLRETQQHGEDVARIVSQALAFSIVGHDYHTIQLLLDEITQAQDIGYARVLSGKGNLMAESGTSPESGSGWTMFNKEVMFDQKPVGRIVIGLDNQGIIDRLQSQKTSIISREAIIIILIALGEFLALSYIIVRPVGIISRSLDMSIDDTGKITRQIPLRSNDEFGKLATQFNDMREQLNAAHLQLQSKIDLADVKLTENNSKLQEQAVELRRMNEELKQIAVTDPLTGLYNRRYFDRVVQTDLALSVRHGDINSILAVDVDHFKHINDQHGHKTGDTVLVDLARVLGTNLRRTDLVCRFGGEEFIVLCRRTDQEESRRLGEKLRRAVAEHVFLALDGSRIGVTISVGAATFPDGKSGLPVEDYIHRADLAMYHSKSTGRNRVTHFVDVIDPEILSSASA
jgi:diguanylate cyclase (GGDEF)-like protein